MKLTLTFINWSCLFAGVGGFGKVYRGYYRGNEIAVKAARGDANESPELTKDRVLQVNFDMPQ